MNRAGRKLGIAAITASGISVSFLAMLLVASPSVRAQAPDDGNGPPPPRGDSGGPGDNYGFDAAQGGGGFGGQGQGGPGGGGGFGGGQGRPRGGGGGFGGQGQGGPGGGFGGQRGGGPGGMPGPITVTRTPFSMLSSALHLSEEQRGKVAVILEEAHEAQMGQMGGGPAGGPPQGGMRAQDTATAKKIEAVLTRDQAKRLDSLMAALRTLQSGGVQPQIIGKLNLTDKQIDSLAAAAPAEMANGEMPDPDAMQAARLAGRQALKSILTPAQQTIVQSAPRPMNRRPGGQGGGGGGGFGGPGGGGPGGGGFGGPPGGGPGGGGGPDGGGPPPPGGGQ